MPVTTADLVAALEEVAAATHDFMHAYRAKHSTGKGVRPNAPMREQVANVNSTVRALATILTALKAGEVVLVPARGKQPILHVGAALQAIADTHADVLNRGELNALYAASERLWDDKDRAMIRAQGEKT